MVKDELGDRMKKYEYISRTHLTPRVPVVLRLDGKSFHTFTRGFKKPFDMILVKSMQATTKYLCENIQGCVLGYTQSDEITLVLIDYKKINSCPWFDYNIQKCTSVAASMATMFFNKFFVAEAIDYAEQLDEMQDVSEQEEKYHNTLVKAVKAGAMFDARVFNVPKEEVTNCLLWRQNDATRNSIQSVGQANFSHKELQGKSCNDIQDMLMLQKGINWNDFPTTLKRGSCCIKVLDTELTGNTDVIRPKWVIDDEIPIFKGDGRKYVDDLVYVGE